MKIRLPIIVVLLSGVFGVTAIINCSGTATNAPIAKPAQPAPVKLEPSANAQLRVDPPIWMSVADVEQNCEQGLSQASTIRDDLIAFKGMRNSENTLEPINEILIQLAELSSLSHLYTSAHPSKEVRDAAEQCEQKTQKFYSEFELSREIFDALGTLNRDDLDAMALRFTDHLLRDYRRAGVDKDEATRKELAELREEMVKTAQDYSRRLREGKEYIEVNKEDLAGLPKDFLAAREPTENGRIKISTDYPDFIPVTTFAKEEKVRKEIYYKFLNRAHPDNEDTLKKTLALRHAYATKLGYPDWAAYNAEDKMVKDKKVVREFIEKVATIARPRMKDDLDDILARKKQDSKNARKVRVWDRFYYVNKVQAEKYDVDAQVVRAYFEYDQVKNGLLKLNEDLFGVKFVQRPNVPVWHRSVDAYDVREGDETIGRIYLDMHPRDGKFSHAAEFSLLPGIEGRQLPSGALVCNFPEPAEGRPALMEHGEVTTFFHEFGHLMHNILGGHHKWAELSGIACEWDFVEVPSQLMEEWAWNYEVLKRFAKHYETGEVIPQDLVERMRKAREFGKGAHVMRQMFLAGLSYNFHDGDPSKLDPMALLKQTQKKYNPYPYEKNTHIYSNFGHLQGYSSAYYTYMWSLVIVKDIFNKFKENGIMDKETAMAYRRAILDPGGTVDAQEMVRNFLGRDYAFDAFEGWLKTE